MNTLVSRAGEICVQRDTRWLLGTFDSVTRRKVLEAIAIAGASCRFRRPGWLWLLCMWMPRVLMGRRGGVMLRWLVSCHSFVVGVSGR